MCQQKLNTDWLHIFSRRQLSVKKLSCFTLLFKLFKKTFFISFFNLQD